MKEKDFDEFVKELKDKIHQRQTEKLKFKNEFLNNIDIERIVDELADNFRRRVKK